MNQLMSTITPTEKPSTPALEVACLAIREARLHAVYGIEQRLMIIGQAAYRPREDAEIR